MTKKKKKESVSVEEIVNVVGTPTLMFLPARNYKFKVNTTEHVLTIPRKGNYIELDSDHFTEEDGEFNILEHVDDDDADAVLYIPSLTKVLFGASKYPDLSENQAFTPIYLVIRKDEVDIVGNIIDMIMEDTD